MSALHTRAGLLLTVFTLACASASEPRPEDDAAVGPPDAPNRFDAPSSQDLFSQDLPLADLIFLDDVPSENVSRIDRPFAEIVFVEDRPVPQDLGLPRDLPGVLDTAPSGPGEPPFGASSMGTGGSSPVAGSALTTPEGVSYRLIVPSARGRALAVLVVYSGTEGGAVMTRNLMSVAPVVGLSDTAAIVLDGVTYRGNAAAGASALDEVRRRYDIDNDRTYLLGESAGTTAALALGFTLRQTYFAAYWANDVNATGRPARSAAELGFAPWGNAGPGGQLAAATSIVSAMRAAGYRISPPAPYDGPGAGTHGDTNQFLAALRFFAGRTRRP